jgi:hypothetical protein
MPPASSSNNGSSASSHRRGKGQDEDGNTSVRKDKGPDVENGSRQYTRQHDDGSDGDELGDSDSERGEVDQSIKKVAKVVAPVTSTKPPGTGRGRGRPSAASIAAAKAAAAAAASGTPPATTNQASSLAASTTKPTYASSSGATFSSKMPASPSLTSDRPSAVDASKVSRNASAAPISSSSKPMAVSSSSSSAPYYYNSQSSATLPSGGPSRDPRDAQSKNRMPPFTTMTGGSSGTYKAEAASSTSAQSSSNNNTEDLTMHEVDKFLDLIEKHNLHTSNEDDMARSVTELYQEWLEWCAKRSVQSTKSKQALVAEFVRIHQGEYGRLRQQRAMEIVKGSAGGLQEGDVNPLTTDLAEPATYLPPSKSAPSISAASRLKEEEVSLSYSLFTDEKLNIPPQLSSKSIAASTGAKRGISGYTHVPSPSVAPRALTPSSSSAVYDNHGQAEALYHRIREEVWKDASVMIERVIHEQTAVILEKNSALRGRVEQLEIHSDNLAQWIQHLNRVQDDLTQSIQSAAAAPPLREEVRVMEEPSAKYGRHPHETQQRTYAPTYLTSSQSSPKRSYAIRRSPSPPIISHHSSSSIPPPRRPIDEPRDYRHPSLASHGRSAMSDSYDRTYYSYPADDREHAPPPLPAHSSPHLAKRPRNGY